MLSSGIVLLVGGAGFDLGLLSSCMRNHTAFRHAQHPLDCFKIHLANVGIAPGLLSVAEGRIENAALAVHFVPRDSEIMVSSVDARVRVVELRWIQTEQDVDFVA